MPRRGKPRPAKRRPGSCDLHEGGRSDEISSPSCGVASFGGPSCVWPSCVWPSCAWPSCAWPSCGSPSSGEPSCVWPSCVWPSCEWPSYEWPSYEWPSYEWPSYEWPSCAWPSYEWPSCAWPSSFELPYLGYPPVRGLEHSGLALYERTINHLHVASTCTTMLLPPPIGGHNVRLEGNLPSFFTHSAALEPLLQLTLTTCLITRQ